MTTAAGQTDIQRVRDATDLVRLIGEHVALRPQGREFVGLCPFHDDHRPSLRVVVHKDHAFYKCFSCGAAGDCFRFVMDYHKMEFPEALKYLAEKAGITLEARAVTTARGSDEGPGRAGLQKAARFAAEFFQRTLDDPVAGAAARHVVATRGISDQMVRDFLLGAAPEGYDGFLSTLRNKPSAIRTALAAGLLKQRSAGDGCYDTFRHRLIFPICDDVGRPIAFGGRIINPDDNPKYLNSPENALFNKSRTLYGLHLAKRSIIESGLAIVTEGYTDVIACHQAGLTNVVGTLGTALTADHARILSRLCDTVVLVFDGDEAGRKAADRAVRVLFAEPVDIKLCVLPEDCDPDDLLKRDDGVEQFRAAVDAAVPALQYKLRRLQAHLAASGSGPSARQKLLERFMAELAELGFGSMPGVRKRLVYNEICDLFSVALADVERALPRRRAPRRPAARVTTAPDTLAAPPPDETPSELLGAETDTVPVSRALRLAEREVLAIALFEPAAAAGHDNVQPLTTLLSLADFADPPSRRIAEAMWPRLTAAAPCTLPDILTDLPAAETRSLASQLFFEGRRRCEDSETGPAETLLAAAVALRDCRDRDRYHQQLASLHATQGKPAGAEEILAVLERIKEQHRRGDVPAAIPQGLRS